MTYLNLLKHYDEMFELFDHIHFNSSVSEAVYKDNINVSNSSVLSITHGGIKDNRKYRTFEDKTLNLTFIGSTSKYKGFPLLKSVLQELDDEGYSNWALEVWGGVSESASNKVSFKGNFSSNELELVFAKDRLLIVPSIWNETFGFTALESISFGIPVLVSSTVGAKDVVEEYDDWFVFNTRKTLKEKLQELMTDKTRLHDFNKKIMDATWQYSLVDHSEKMVNIYSNIIKAENK